MRIVKAVCRDLSPDRAWPIPHIVKICTYPVAAAPRLTANIRAALGLDPLQHLRRIGIAHHVGEHVERVCDPRRRAAQRHRHLDLRHHADQQRRPSDDQAFPCRLQIAQCLERHFDTVDVHLADQLLLILALAEGESEYLVPDITRHLESNRWVIQQFIDRPIKIDSKKGTVRIAG